MLSNQRAGLPARNIEVRHFLIPMVLLVLGLLTYQSLVGQEKRAITAKDCVQVRYLPSDDPYRRSILLNPQGDRVAYLVKVPNLSKNVNEISLYVKQLSGPQSAGSRRLATGPEVSQINWLRNGTEVVFLGRYRGHVAVMKGNVLSGVVKPWFSAPEDIVEYTVDRDADVLAYATDLPSESTGRLMHSAEELASGYRIPFEEKTNVARKKRKLHLVVRGKEGQWSASRDILIRSPFSHEELETLPYLFHFSLSLSPDGRKLAVTYPESTSELPAEWQRNPTIHEFMSMVQEVYIMVLYDTQSTQTAFPFQSPMVYSIPVWARDGHSFFVNADPPLQSSWHRADAGHHVFFSPHLFSVSVADGEAKEILPRTVSLYEGLLALTASGEVFARVTKDTIVRMAQSERGWEERDRFRIPVDPFYRFAQIASDGETVVGDSQSTSQPPTLFYYKRGESNISILAHLNPQFDDLRLATVRKVSWATSTGETIHGLLFTPPSFEAGRPYPLVIHTKLEVGQFLCDTGDSHYPSFAPQPLANAGILYLMRSWPEENQPNSDVPFYPKGYPGVLGEAAFQMDMWDSAVKSLAAEGLVDPTRVGIIGFSRTGWYTEFILSHSSVTYRAATTADNVTYSPGAYWLFRNEANERLSESIYGGPPYGPSFDAWRKYSSALNADKIRTPVLMEEMGYGQRYDNVNAPPLWLAVHFELFTALNRLHKPVELYYYPDEGHQPDHPKARLATLQRNVDWYRYWLQGYERPDAEASGQYARWHAMPKTSDLVGSRGGEDG